MSGEERSNKEPLTQDERDYFNQRDHDLLQRHDAILFAPTTGLEVTVLRNTNTLYGDGTKDHPGIVNVLYEHIRNQEQTDKKRYRSLQLLVGTMTAIILLSDLVITFFRR